MVAILNDLLKWHILEKSCQSRMLGLFYRFLENRIFKLGVDIVIELSALVEQPLDAQSGGWYILLQKYRRVYII